MTKTIRLGNGRDMFLDECDYEKYKHLKWQCSNRGYAFYRKWKHPVVFIHRLIMDVHDKNQWVDHINGNPLDNRRSNLRLCTKSQNAINSIRRNKAGYRGVNIVRDKWSLNYAANITVDKKRIYLGCFSTPEAAAIAYNSAAIKYHGEFAKLNELFV